MGLTRKLLWKIYIAVLGGLSTLVVQKALQASWKAATGDKPPAPNDPRTPLSEAAIWALASGVGVGVVQLLTNRFAARRFMAKTGTDDVAIPTFKITAPGKAR